MEPDELASDLGFVRQAVERNDSDHRSPKAIYLLWAAISLAGFPLVDFAPRWVSTYWMVAGPAGFVISAFLGWQSGRKAGEMRSDVGMRYLLHWGGMMGAIALAVVMIPTGAIEPKSISPIILLLLALTYFLGGVHLERPMIWLGLLLAAGYLVVLFAVAYAWTILGVITSIALASSAVLGRTDAEARR